MTESVLGMVSVRKLMTLFTSNSSRLSTSPEWRISRPRHSERSMRSSIRCCMRFCAFIPRMLRTHTDAMFSAKSHSMSAAMMPTAKYMEPFAEPDATSMACFTAHTCERLVTTCAMPVAALSTACSLLPRHCPHSHFIIRAAVYCVSGILSICLIFIW